MGLVGWGLPLLVYDFLFTTFCWWVGLVGGLVDWWWVGLVGGGLPLFVYNFLFTTFCSRLFVGRWLVVGLVGWWVGMVGGGLPLFVYDLVYVF